jgi:hypothetical protein
LYGGTRGQRKKGKPNVNFMVCKGVGHRVEVGSDANVHVADLRFGHLADGPLCEGVLELFGGKKEGFDAR